jgi:hypothetical protein
VSRKKRKIVGYSTSYPALTAFIDYIEGRSTLEQFRNCKVSSITTPIYSDGGNEAEVKPEMVSRSSSQLKQFCCFLLGVIVGFTLWYYPS